PRNLESSGGTGRLLALTLLAGFGVFGQVVYGFGEANAQSRPTIPNFWDPQEQFVKPDISNRPRLRFLTTTDFPPFSYIDERKQLSGFHVDLARAICAELSLDAVCQIQALPFDDLVSALGRGAGDAILAGQAVTAASRRQIEFTRPYFHLPARFIMRLGEEAQPPLASGLRGKRIGVVMSSAHAAYAQAWFGDMVLNVFDTQDAALAALEGKKIDAFFGDALSLSFWMQQRLNRPCCAFVGGPFLSNTYFGNGMAIGVAKDDAALTNALNFALRSINDKGTFAELYLRYFPISLY
ncbi:MAG: transporter substrate-binding domain-containing protein, partial [Pseudomonadota bacterium]